MWIAVIHSSIVKDYSRVKTVSFFVSLLYNASLTNCNVENVTSFGRLSASFSLFCRLLNVIKFLTYWGQSKALLKPNQLYFLNEIPLWTKVNPNSQNFVSPTAWKKVNVTKIQKYFVTNCNDFIRVFLCRQDILKKRFKQFKAQKKVIKCKCLSIPFFVYWA